MLGRDIKDYYRAFILNPFSWWKTYTFALGSYWFNPYLPFGGSSCTSIAQRQSYAVIAMARVVGVKANMAAMLDDFLLVVPRLDTDSDKEIIQRGEKVGRDFDELLARLHLPKAPAKDQEAAFTTVWCGVEFFSKKRLVGVPENKWVALRKWIDEEFTFAAQEGLPHIEAGTLQSALGKFCHAMLIWPAGRPCLYHLWSLLFTACYSDRTRAKLSMPQQPLTLTEGCIKAVLKWKERLKGVAPRRRIVPCHQKVPVAWVALLRYTSALKPRAYGIFVATPLGGWTEAEPLGECKADSLMVCWLSLLLETLQLLDLSKGEVEMVIVRTNIRKLAAAIDADCYVRSVEGALIASEIHDHLDWPISSTNELPPVELRAVLLDMHEDKLSDCVAALLN